MPTSDEYKALRKLIESALVQVKGRPKLAYTIKEAIAATGIGKT